jgi:Leucine-rich repeat (LRR) protein
MRHRKKSEFREWLPKPFAKSIFELIIHRRKAIFLEVTPFDLTSLKLRLLNIVNPEFVAFHLTVNEETKILEVINKLRSVSNLKALRISGIYKKEIVLYENVFKKLESLSLCGLELEYFPRGLDEIQKLTRIEFNYTDWQDLSPVLKTQAGFKRMDAINRKIEDFPFPYFFGDEGIFEENTEMILSLISTYSYGKLAGKDRRERFLKMPPSETYISYGYMMTSKQRAINELHLVVKQDKRIPIDAKFNILLFSNGKWKDIFRGKKEFDLIATEEEVTDWLLYSLNWQKRTSVDYDLSNVVEFFKANNRESILLGLEILRNAGKLPDYILSMVLGFSFANKEKEFEEKIIDVIDNNISKKVWLYYKNGHSTKDINEHFSKSVIKSVFNDCFQCQFDLNEISVWRTFFSKEQQKSLELSLDLNLSETLPDYIKILSGQSIVNCSINFFGDKNIFPLLNQLSVLKQIHFLKLTAQDKGLIFPYSGELNLVVKNVEFNYFRNNYMPEKVVPVTFKKAETVVWRGKSWYSLSLSLFPALQNLIMMDSYIETINFEVASKTLKYLTLRNLEGVDSWLDDSNYEKLSNLEKVNIQNCGIKQVPEGIRHLKNLKEFHLVGSETNEIPLFLKEMRALKIININQ